MVGNPGRRAAGVRGSRATHPARGAWFNKERLHEALDEWPPRAPPQSALVNTPLNATTLLSGTLAIASTLCLWWLYFRAEPIALKHVTGTRDTMYASRMAANGVMLTVAGLIVLAAGNALVIYDPSATASTATVVMLFGGPILFLLAHVWYLRKVYGVVALGQLATIGALAAMGGWGCCCPRSSRLSRSSLSWRVS